ncbi:20188_t:CDS:2 [Funneliformis geosporum]|uniref:14275_t:CDS:1 n=1 Tax=Funneliformis geosporum TaxID=1117311 RepID=A0A9W4WQT8_9GLOM|nr:20188_t:CDS:2 [Funneliformis geosporum]CAI2165210.1 14275_t:CDS:2 [Funneliformis geosporum]
MTRYTKLEKKKYEKATGFEGFNIKPLQLDEAIEQDNSEIKEQKNKRSREEKLEPSTPEICFGCRKKGHSVKDCPEAKEQGVGMCYNCSSTEHIAKDCKKTIKQGDEYLYAKCFICNEQGHLSRHCLKNEKGLYPNGGSCRFCSQVTHLAKDCALKNPAIGTSVVVGKLDLQHGADDDDFHIQVLEKSEEKLNTVKSGKNKLKKKIVKF